jgi:hypothetical protein
LLAACVSLLLLGVLLLLLLLLALDSARLGDPAARRHAPAVTQKQAFCCSADAQLGRATAEA